MKTLDEVIKALEVCTSGYCSHPKHGDCPYLDERNDCDTRQRKLDALHYLKEYKKQKYIWKKLYLLAHQIFWGLEEEYPLDGEYIRNLCFDACIEGFDDEDD